MTEAFVVNVFVRSLMFVFRRTNPGDDSHVAPSSLHTDLLAGVKGERSTCATHTRNIHN